MVKRKRYPFTAAVRRATDSDPWHPWDIEELISSGGLEGATSIKMRRMAVPLDATDHALAVRVHETLHAQYSPVKAPLVSGHTDEINDRIVQCAEDARIHIIGRSLRRELNALDTPHSLAQNLTTFQRAAINGSLSQRERKLFALACVQRIGTRCLDQLLSAAAKLAVDDPDLLDLLGKCRELAKDVASYYAGDHSQSALGIAASYIAARLLDFTQPHLPKDPPPHDAPIEIDCDIFSGLGVSTSTAGCFGPMTIEEPPRPIPLPAKLRLRARRRATDFGTALRFPARYCIDRRVFATTRRRLGAAILIDASGSMGLGPRDVMSILNQAPASVVACYSGTIDRQRGILRVLARDGRRVCDPLVCAPAGNANVVDGPALVWLAKQRGPRFWISDGDVSGVGDRQSEALLACVDQVCKLAAIVRFENVRQLNKAIAARSKRK